MQNYKIVSIPFSSRKNTKSFQLHGEFLLLVSKKNIINDWKINIDYCLVDLYTTKSWFNKNNRQYTTFLERQKLFEILNIEPQQPRPSKNPNKLVKLKDEAIDKLNFYLNNEFKNNKGTYKNIIKILKGNNPGGGLKNPNGDELFYYKDSEKINFLILIKTLTIANNSIYQSHWVCVLEENKLDYLAWLDTDESLKTWFNDIASKKDVNYSDIPVLIKKYLKQINDCTNVLLPKINESISAFNKIKINSIFCLTFSGVEEKHHIKPKHLIIDESVELYNDGQTKKSFSILNEIYSVDNLIGIDPTLHTFIHKNILFFNTDGSCMYTKQEYKYSYPDIEKNINNWYIYNEQLTEKRLYFIKQYIDFIKSKNII